MSVGLSQPFQPTAPTVAVSASTTSASAVLNASGDSMLFFNSTAATAFVRSDVGTPTATAGDVPIPAGGRALLNCGQYATAVAVLLASGTGTVYVTRGIGSTY